MSQGPDDFDQFAEEAIPGSTHHSSSEKPQMETAPSPQSWPSSAVEPSVPSTTSESAKQPNFRLARRIFFGFLGFIAIVAIAVLVVLSFDLPPMELIENPNSDLSTQLISADGVVLQKYYSHENRVNLKLNEVSPNVINALIAAEDARYYSHAGIDPKSFFSIAYALMMGDEVRGGSTITMQLVRNLYQDVGDDGDIVRKLKEYLVSAILERRFTKEEIIEAYLNTVNIYGDAYGIETSSNRLFDKSARDLNIEESALLVGMLKGQGVYNPFRKPENALNRRNVVIGQMVKYGFVDSTKINVDSIKKIPLSLGLARQEQEHVKGLAPYFREEVRKWLNQWCAENGKDLYADGLKVYTTIDSRMQAHAELAVRDHMKELQSDFDRMENRGEKIYRRDPSLLLDLKRQSARWVRGKAAGKSESELEAEFNKPIDMNIFTWVGSRDTVMSPMDSLRHYARFLETGMVSIDPNNGHVKAWVGGIDFGYFKYDHVQQGKRQVGSTFKPFVYGAAMEAGIDPCKLYQNQQVTIKLPSGQNWTPKNSGNESGGMVSLRYGLAHSLNVVTAQLINDITPKYVADFAHKVGIESDLDEVHSLALGTTDLSVLEMARAYSTFANSGNVMTPILVTRIEDRNGKILYESEQAPKNVLSEKTAYTIVKLLQGVVDLGTGRRLRYKYKFTQEIGGKTGTTQNQSDGWFMGITPNLVTGVWVGAQDRRVRFSSISYGQGANMALPIWALYMKGVYGDARIALPQDGFRRPDGYNVDFNCQDKSSSNGPKPTDLPTSDDFGAYD
ncbi:MAG: transglycosylase domain-containing protein [Bacteroidia bacterium]|nr:transglycosylase domain-containing protein [Bacteroidia bacterium]